MTAFWIAATVMAAAALAFVVPRLLSGPRATANPGDAGAVRRKLKSLAAARADGHLDEVEYERRRQQLASEWLDRVDRAAPVAGRSPATAYTLLILTPLAAVALYLLVGSPRAIVAAGSPAPPAATAAASGGEAQAPELSTAITQLAARLAQNPTDVDGWYLLGRSYMAVGRHADARDAFARALELAPGEPALMVEYAEAIAFTSGQRQLPEEAETVLRDALARQPDSQKALWMLGIGAFQRQDYRTALDYWERLEALLEPDGPVARQVGEQIAAARAALGDGPAAEAAAEPAPAAASDDGDTPALTIEVSLADELQARVDPNDTLFVFARAVSGPRMPLAIQRLPAASLPTRVRLDASMGMVPNMNLATFPEVVVGARISKSGSAVPQPGDLEALSDPVSNRRPEPVRLLIDRVL